MKSVIAQQLSSLRPAINCFLSQTQTNTKYLQRWEMLHKCSHWWRKMLRWILRFLYLLKNLFWHHRSHLTKIFDHNRMSFQQHLKKMFDGCQKIFQVPTIFTTRRTVLSRPRLVTNWGMIHWTPVCTSVQCVQCVQSRCDICVSTGPGQ